MGRIEEPHRRGYGRQPRGTGLRQMQHQGEPRQTHARQYGPPGSTQAGFQLPAGVMSVTDLGTMPMHYSGMGSTESSSPVISPCSPRPGYKSPRNTLGY